MAIIVKTESPRTLLAAIKKAIDEDAIQTWDYDSDGDFIHTADQWTKRAWLRPSIHEGVLVFNIIPPRSRNISRVVYGIYHGRFIEMLATHFDKRFTEAAATALPRGADRVKSQTAGV